MKKLIGIDQICKFLGTNAGKLYWLRKRGDREGIPAPIFDGRSGRIPNRRKYVWTDEGWIEGWYYQLLNKMKSNQCL